MEKKVVLLVDDQEDLLKVIGLRIQSWGYDLIEAKNGKEALELFESKRPDIVVLDYMLPDLNGIDILKNMRKNNNETPVIMFTAYPNTTAMKGAEKLGVSAFIPKLSEYSDSQPLLKTALHMAGNHPRM